MNIMSNVPEAAVADEKPFAKPRRPLPWKTVIAAALVMALAAAAVWWFTRGPVITVVAVKRGAAAEIGSMVVTEQIDALRMCAADPIDYLIKPRFAASVLMTTVLTVVSA